MTTAANGGAADRSERVRAREHVARSRRHVGVLIVGAGFAGLGAAIRLMEDGRDDFVLIERADEVGGTWRDNTYPGAACDVPSHLYSFSFQLNPRWSRSFSPQSEIQDYLRSVARQHKLDHNSERALFGAELVRAEWDDAAATWLVDTTRGDFAADVLISAVGALCEPRLPDIKGIERFRGQLFHSARWDHDADLAGKRVALIGTGASAIQIGPAIVDEVAHLSVFQRTAPWVMPRHDRDYPRAERLAYQRVPGLQRAAREAIYWGREFYMVGFGYQTKVLQPAQWLARRNIDKAIRDPALRERLTPDWRIGCKRILISNSWYPMLARDDVDLVTEGIAEIREHSIVTADGVEREVDAIVVATGFHVTDSPTYERIIGRSDRRLADMWDERGQQAYKGSAVAGFPNLLFLVGPNTGLGHTSMVFMIESQLNYLSDALATMRRLGLATFEVRAEAQRAWNERLRSRMRKTVWTTGGCASWYLDKHGNNTTLWPDFTFTFRRQTRRFDLDQYETTRRAPTRDPGDTRHRADAADASAPRLAHDSKGSSA